MHKINVYPAETRAPLAGWLTHEYWPHIKSETGFELSVARRVWSRLVFLLKAAHMLRSKKTLTLTRLTLRRALKFANPNPKWAKWLTLTSRSGMLSFVAVPFTNGSPMGMGKMTTFFHPYTSPLSIFFFFRMEVGLFEKWEPCSCWSARVRGAVGMCSIARISGCYFGK